MKKKLNAVASTKSASTLGTEVPAQKIKTAYIAGKVTGLPTNQVLEKFSKKHQELSALGFAVFNPVSLVSDAEKRFEVKDPPLFKGWNEYMKFLLQYMLNCDVVYMLPCWKESKGATLERDIALRLGIEIVYC